MNFRLIQRIAQALLLPLWTLTLHSCTPKPVPVAPSKAKTYRVVSDPPPPPQPPPWKPLPPRGSLLSLDEYLEPPQEVVQLLEHESEPTVLLHTASSTLVRMYEQPLLPMSQLSRPRLGLAGMRIDPENHTQGTGALYTRLVLSRLNDPEVRIDVSTPRGALISNAFFSPDGSQLAVALVYSKQTQVAIVDSKTGELRVLATGPLSAVWTEPCNWTTND